jgi:transposase
MKTQLSKPARGRASYPDEYKQQALELWRASGRSAAKGAAELGIRPPLLYRWACTERKPNEPKAGRKSRRSLEELEAEIRRLREENGNRSGVRATYLHRLIDGYWSPELEAVSTRRYLKMLIWLDRRESSVKRRL